MIPREEIDAILFDLDGTLVDTDNAAVDRLVRRLRPLAWLFRHRDPAPFSRWLMMQVEVPGNILLMLLDMLGVDEALTVLSDKLRNLRHRQTAEFRPIEGVAKTLEELSACYKLALVTNRSRRHIAQFCTHHPDISRHLDEFISRQDTVRFKPHPAPLMLAARRLGVPIGRCLMVGDSTVDVQAARRAGAWSAAVVCGFGYPDDLAQAGADLVLANINELDKILGC